jgi:hypothetical protein
MIVPAGGGRAERLPHRVSTRKDTHVPGRGAARLERILFSAEAAEGQEPPRDHLLGVTCASAGDCWSVGGYNWGGKNQTLIGQHSDLGAVVHGWPVGPLGGLGGAIPAVLLLRVRGWRQGGVVSAPKRRHEPIRFQAPPPESEVLTSR